MSTMTRNVAQAATASGQIYAEREATLDNASTAFGISAAVAILFNTVLAWVKDSYDPLNSFMAHLTGHHWITHGLADILVFLIIGAFLMNRGLRVPGSTVVTAVTGAVVVGGAGLAAWFFLL